MTKHLNLNTFVLMALGVIVEVSISTTYHHISDKLDAITQMQEHMKYIDDRLKIVEVWKERMMELDGVRDPPKQLRSPKDAGKNTNEP